jgi:hypothetical protein
MFSARKVAGYRPPVRFGAGVGKSVENMLNRSALDDAERFGIIYGGWGTCVTTITGIKDVTEEYAKERGVCGVTLQDGARQKLFASIKQGKKNGRGVLGHCHTHLGGKGDAEPTDKKLLENCPEALMGIIHWDRYAAPANIALYKFDGSTNGTARMCTRGFPAELTVRAVKTLSYYWEIGDADPFD